YIVSHDLQEPLRTVSSFLQLLAKHCKGQLDESADEYIQLAVDGAKRMQRLINDLLVYARATYTSQAMVQTSLEDVYAEVEQMLKASIEETGSEIEHDPLP